MKLKPIEKRVYRNDRGHGGYPYPGSIEYRLQYSQHFTGRLAKYIQTYESYLLEFQLSDPKKKDYLKPISRWDDVRFGGNGRIYVAPPKLVPGSVVMLTGREIKIKEIADNPQGRVGKKRQRPDRGTIYLEILIGEKTAFIERHKISLKEEDLKKDDSAATKEKP